MNQYFQYLGEAHCVRIGIDTDLHSDSLYVNGVSDNILTLKAQYQNQHDQEFTWDSEFELGRTKTLCSPASTDWGNVTKVFLKHNMRFLHGLKLRFIQVQNSPGDKKYSSWAIESFVNPFWIRNETCKANDWCQLRGECKYIYSMIPRQ